MKNLNIRESQTGTTLVELLIGIAIAGMVFLVTSSLILALFNSNNRSKQLDTLEQAKNNLNAEMTNTIKWARTVSAVPNQISLTAANDDEIVYSYDALNKTLLKNNQRLIPEDILVTGFDVKNFSADRSVSASLEITVEMEHKHFAAVKDRLRIVVSQRIFNVVVKK